MQARAGIQVEKAIDELRASRLIPASSASPPEDRKVQLINKPKQVPAASLMSDMQRGGCRVETSQERASEAETTDMAFDSKAPNLGHSSSG